MSKGVKSTTNQILTIYDLYFNKHHSTNDIFHDDRVKLGMSTIENFIRAFKYIMAEQPVPMGYRFTLGNNFREACETLGLPEYSCPNVDNNDNEDESVIVDPRTPEAFAGIHESIDALCGMTLELIDLIKDIKNKLS